jgi:hypothetical protein
VFCLVADVMGWDARSAPDGAHAYGVGIVWVMWLGAWLFNLVAEE